MKVSCKNCIHYGLCEYGSITGKNIECKDYKGTNDYIKIVRCKDCAVPHNKWTGCPKLGGLVTPLDFYCGFGIPEITEDIL